MAAFQYRYTEDIFDILKCYSSAVIWSCELHNYCSDIWKQFWSPNTDDDNNPFFYHIMYNAKANHQLRCIRKEMVTNVDTYQMILQAINLMIWLGYNLVWLRFLIFRYNSLFLELIFSTDKKLLQSISTYQEYIPSL